MKTLEKRDERKKPASLDRAFNEWVPRHALAEMVPHLVKEVRETPANGANESSAWADMTLAILVYCYSIGIYRSREIELRLSRTAACGATPSQPRIAATALAQFRRLHAPLVKECLASALFQAFRVQWTANGSRETLPPRPRFFGNHQPSDPNQLLLLEVEAERRLEIAEALDRFDQEGSICNAERRG